jgi:hypothetical protein
MGLYSQGNDVMIISLEDCTGRRLFKYKTNADDEEEVRRILQSFIDKKALNLKVVREKSKVSPFVSDEEFEF